MSQPFWALLTCRRRAPSAPQAELAATAEHCKYCGLALSHARSHEELSLRLVENGVICLPTSQDSVAARAFRSVDKGHFIRHLSLQAGVVDSDDEEVPEDQKHIRVRLRGGVDHYREGTVPEWAYLDTPIELPVGQENGLFVQMSAPHVHATCLRLAEEFLDRRSADGACLRVLDIGSGTGYMTVLLSKLCREHSASRGPLAVAGVERVVEVQRATVKVLEDLDFDTILGSENGVKEARGDAFRYACASQNFSLTVMLGDTEGSGTCQDVLMESSSFDLIHCGCSVEEIPEKWKAALRPGGRIIAPVGEAWSRQMLSVCDRGSGPRAGSFALREVIPVTYVPFQKGITVGSE